MMSKFSLKNRYRRERFFVAAGIGSIAIALLFLLILFSTTITRGWSVFMSAAVELPITLDANKIGAQGDENVLRYQSLIKQSLREHFTQAKTRADKKQLYQLLSFSAAVRLKNHVAKQPDLVGQRITLALPVSAAAERLLKNLEDEKTLMESATLSQQQINWLNAWQDKGQVVLAFNYQFFTNGDSRDAENAGIGGALLGSFYSLLIAFLLTFPVGVLTSVYLELFAPRNRWFNFIEININNLAAVPSVIFGLLGLAIFINFFELPRSSPLVGGLVLSLMTLPTIVITARAALSAVPPSLLAGALSLGATKIQGVFHHVLPAALPGILTGAIIGMAQALGETAPLLMIGMVSFIVDLPMSITDAATALPVQIFLWADSPERGFVERTSAAIIVLLVFLLLMNTAAVILRKRLQIKW